MVGAAGIEPATLGLEIRCSIRLSYAPSKIHALRFYDTVRALLQAGISASARQTATTTPR